MPEQALVVLDAADELHFLWQAPLWSDVRGAAALVETLSRFTLPTLARQREFGGAGIISGGRRYVATFPSLEAAARFVEEARRTYRQRTAALGLLGDVLPVGTDALVTRFGSALRRIRQRLERPAARAETRLGASSPELRWCDACRRYPAVHTVGGDVICRACAHRRTQLADQGHRLALRGYQAGLADAGEEDLAGRPASERLLRWLRDSGVARTGDAAADIAGLAGRRAPAAGALRDEVGRCAVVTVEVADFAHTFEQIADSQQALRTAVRVNRLLDEALFEAISSVAWRNRARPFPFDVLLAGGDRAVFVLPADVAITATARLVRNIESQSSGAAEGRRLGLCAGVGVAPAGGSLASAALQGQAALTMANAAYARQLASPRGAWRSVVAFSALEPEGVTSLNVGELERCLTHARTLRRSGLAGIPLPPVIPLLQPETMGALPWLAMPLTDPQRRALVAVARDLTIGASESGPPAAANLWSAIVGLAAWTSPEMPVPLTRNRMEYSAGAIGREEQSA